MIKENVELFKAKLGAEVKKHFPCYSLLSFEFDRFSELSKPTLRIIFLMKKKMINLIFL